MSKLRTYAPLSRKSAKVKAQDEAFKSVYEEVRERSEGRCEVNFYPASSRLRCPRRATDMHHLVKPRRSHTEPSMLVHCCRDHHDRFEWPYRRGRLCAILVNGVHVFFLRFASDKFAARAEA